MTWIKLTDTFVDKPVFEDLDFATRWHYLALVAFACRNERANGLIRNVDARRASDHPDPARANAELTTAGLLQIEGNAYRIVEIDQHYPPPHVVRKAEQDKLRKRRERAHKVGDHSMCLPGNCPHVTEDVTRDIGTGRDGTGRLDTTGVPEQVDSWETAIPGRPGLKAVS